MSRSQGKTLPASGVERTELISGRRGMLAKMLAGTVASIAHGQLQGANKPIEIEFIRGIAKADIGNELKGLSDEAIEKIDTTNPNVGKARMLIEHALGRIHAVMKKLQPGK